MAKYFAIKCINDVEANLYHFTQQWADQSQQQNLSDPVVVAWVWYFLRSMMHMCSSSGIFFLIFFLFLFLSYHFSGFMFYLHEPALEDGMDLL